MPNASPAPPKVGSVQTGIFQATRRAGGFVVLEAAGIEDVRIHEEDVGPALHGDQVRVKIVRLVSGRLAEGRIERVLRHANKFIVGRIERSRRISVVRPKNPRLHRLVEIHRQFPPEEVPDGSWVVTEIRHWSDSPHEPLVGRLHEVLGTDDDPRIPVLLLVREGGITPDFPDEVEAEAREVAKRRVSHQEIERRRDFRAERVVTIDPATAKDFDDAVSLVEKRARGRRVAVHVADVAHYVRHGSRLDLEGYDRATSIYPVDRVIPMLPHVLSDDLCSLRPDEDRLTMTAIFDVSESGEISNVELVESVIRSARRFSYEEVQGLFDAADGVESPKHPLPSVSDEIRADLMELRAASRALLAARMRRGSLDLDLPEIEVLFGPDGAVADLRRKERLESHRLIEDLMLAANESVARELTRRAVPLLYRVHDPPDEAKLRKLSPAFSRFGLAFPSKGAVDQAILQRALEKARTHPAGDIVQRLVLRALMRAQYRPTNEGHFGLASECYCHFTSPIRRYPDIVVHRAVKAMLAAHDAESPSYLEPLRDLLPEWGRHTSDREERAQRIEWDARKILVLEFMKRFVGDVFDGFVAGFLPKGFFVELIEWPAEGMVPVRTLGEDWFDLDEQGMALVGRSTGKTIALGDRVTVQVMKVDPLAGEMDLTLVRKPSKGPGEGGKGEREKDRRSRQSRDAMRAGGKYDWTRHAKKKR